MKNMKQDSNQALSRFGRDKRNRSAESVERSPRPRREADNEGQTFRNTRSEGGRRASFNPNFSADNRLKSERSFGSREDRAFGSREERSFGSREDRAPRGEKPRFGSNRFEKGGRTDGYAKKGGRPERNNRFDRSENRFDRDNSRFDRSENRREERDFGSREERGASRDFKSRDFKPRATEGRGGFKGGRKPYRAADGERSYPKYAAKQVGEVRLNRFLAQSGLCSRREADDFITAGLVTVNGQVVTELGTKVRSTDEVKFNDSKVQGEKKVYLVLNKPKGYVTSLEDPHADKTVMELVKGACSERIYPVGRLDKNSLGLLLFTNDGDVTRQLTHPSLEKKKIYQVTLDKPLTRADMEQMTEGLTLEDGEIFVDEVAYVGESKKEVGLEIHSGRNRIVRRIFEHLGYTVQKLDRVYYAGITKKNLKRGQWRFLTREEVERLKSGRYE